MKATELLENLKKEILASVKSDQSGVIEWINVDDFKNVIDAAIAEHKYDLVVRVPEAVDNLCSCECRLYRTNLSCGFDVRHKMTYGSVTSPGPGCPRFKETKNPRQCRVREGK